MRQLQVKKYGVDDSTKLIFLGAVHGNEQCGTNAINRVISMFDSNQITLKKGSVTFIPICNPKAYEKNIREIDANLNRVIDVYKKPNSYEQEIATEIAAEVSQADYMVDLHSSYTDDAPFAFLDYDTIDNNKLVDASEVSYVVSGFPEVYKDCEIEELSTETFANKKAGINGITIECGNHYKEESVDFATKVILNSLKKFAMIDGEFTCEAKAQNMHIEKVIVKKFNGDFTNLYQNFDSLSKGEVVAQYDNGEKIIAEDDCVIILPNKDAHIGHEWFYLAEKC